MSKKMLVAYFSASSVEMNDPAFRPAIAGKLEGMGAELVKRWIIGLLALAMMCLVTACGSKESSDISMQETHFSEDIAETASADRAEGQQTSEHNKILIAYFTWAENAADISKVDVTTSASVQPPRKCCADGSMDSAGDWRRIILYPGGRTVSGRL